jgi:Tfp pilus assembly protein PilV
MERESEKGRKLNENGFSIMEVAIATGIVATCFVTLMSLFAYNYRIEIYNRNKITASYLAQEALEVVKGKRDTNWFDGDAATTWIGNGNGSFINNIPSGTSLVLSAVDKNDLAEGWTIENGGGVGSTKDNIYLNSGRYVQTKNSVAGLTDTGLRRTIDITMEPIASPTYMIVTVHVKTRSSASDLVSITTRLYDQWNE